MKRELTCIVCPLGCTLTAESDADGGIKVSGNTCARGAEYAKRECTAPERTLTTTVAVSGGGVAPVRTDRPVPKKKIFECMAEINKLKICLPITIGSVIIEHIAETDANLVAAINMERSE